MRRLIAASLTLLLTASVFAQTYRWTDANGRTMVTDTPPPAGRSAVQSGSGPVPNDGLTPAARQAAANFPVILYGSAYWQGLLDWLRNTMLAEGKISPPDLDLLVVSDSPEEVRDIISRCKEDECWRTESEAQARDVTRQVLGH